MSAHDDCVLEFLGFLATINNEFGQLSASASKLPTVRSASASVMPVKLQCSNDYADSGVVVSIAVNVELVDPKDSDKRALGASLLLRRPLGAWLAEAELGWTGARIGWDVIDSREAQAGEFALLASQIPELLQWLSGRFQKELAGLS